MKYKVHRFDIKMTKDQARLEQFLNNLEGEVVAIIPNVTIKIMWVPQVNFIHIVEKLNWIYWWFFFDGLITTLLLYYYREIMSIKTVISKISISGNSLFFSALIWFGLGCFGLLFDPTKNLIIISQFVLGLVFLIFYFWFRLKQYIKEWINSIKNGRLAWKNWNIIFYSFYFVLPYWQKIQKIVPHLYLKLTRIFS